MPKSKPHEATAEYAEALTAKPEQATSQDDAADAAVNIPLEDITVPNAADVMRDQALAERKRLAEEAASAVDTWSRSSEKRLGETDEQHQRRIKAEFEDAVMKVRKQEDAPPPPPMAVPSAISEQTKREMAAGAKQSAYWAEQQKQRPLPNAKEIQAAGVNTPVFRPGEYAHEKGGVDKGLVTTQMPTR